METMQVVETWEEYFERVVADGVDLDEAAIQELREELDMQSCLLYLDEIPDAEKHRRLIDMAMRMLSGYRRSGTAAQTVVSGMARPMVRRTETTAFPVLNTSELPNFDDPLQRLGELMGELRQHGDYERIRNEYCQLSISLNLLMLLAPAFRPELVTGKKFGDRVFKKIHRDQIVIDSHWLHATKQFIKVRAKDIEFAPMFKSSKPFPFDLAWQFANKVWTAYSGEAGQQFHAKLDTHSRASWTVGA